MAEFWRTVPSCDQDYHMDSDLNYHWEMYTADCIQSCSRQNGYAL
jgi:hypothetical protein